MVEPLIEPPERVLSTLNPDGTRRWMRPKVAMGRWWRRRRVVAWLLMILFSLIPWLKIGGKPVMLLDVVHREFVFGGTVFQPTEVLLLALLLLGIFFGIFLITAILGRGWCGWACPQTVYLEFLYRPLERWAEGKHRGKAIPWWRIGVKYVVYLVFSLHLANTFLAYFAGPRQVLEWSFGSPADHPAAFAIVLGVTALIMFDFAFFREQMCTLVCPYARLQAVLLDRDSLIIGYDERRGEPRGKMRRQKTEGKQGDCIDCGLCVAACPTGIDIREGLQLECVACTQCIDACDAVMDKIKRPRGLIRFASQNTLSGGQSKFLRPRVFVYPALLLLVFGALGFGLSHRDSSEALFLRNQASTWAESGEDVVQTVLLHLNNRTSELRTYELVVESPSRIVGGQFPFRLDALGMQTLTLTIFTPSSAFHDGRCTLRVTVRDDAGFEQELEQTLFGPPQVPE